MYIEPEYPEAGTYFIDTVFTAEFDNKELENVTVVSILFRSLEYKVEIKLPFTLSCRLCSLNIEVLLFVGLAYIFKEAV